MPFLSEANMDHLHEEEDEVYWLQKSYMSFKLNIKPTHNESISLILLIKDLLCQWNTYVEVWQSF